MNMAKKKTTKGKTPSKDLYVLGLRGFDEDLANKMMMLKYKLGVKSVTSLYIEACKDLLKKHDL